MDSKNNLTEYLSETYPRWVEYAQRYIRRSRLPINPAELVNEVLCSLLERDRERMERLVNAVAGNTTELDLFVMGAIKISIYSPRSPFRYRRGQGYRSIPADSVGEEVPEEEETITDVRDMAFEVLDGAVANDFEKRVFVWKFFDGNPLSKWPGEESKRAIYESYNRILMCVRRRVREKRMG